MEKRTILAFILSFLVLILWSYFYGSRQQPPPTGEEPVIEQQGESVREKGNSPLPQASHPEPTVPKIEPTVQTLENEREIVVETPLYRAVFSNRGATIKSFNVFDLSR